ncbi:flagellar biosynthesis protein FlhA [Lyticum sinuosum]|nr:flagellar biosynthesis protein FlhA [Lyticum sinuosum]
MNNKNLKDFFIFYANKLKSLNQYQQVFFATAILAIISVMLFPVPPFIMDILLCFSISISVLIMMTVLFIDKPLDFSSFPSLLLIVTMLRLALNVSTTRLILSNGHTGPGAAGHIVKAFGYFVMQGSFIIGSIIFIILTIINFVVITKGSGRIAEVAARFSLDAMPGKQMAIDADLSSGAIIEEEARKRRKKLEDESSFYGSMDGANKFVRGDAIAGLLITFVNFLGGMMIGVGQKDMTFSGALQSYTVLTIGDGLVSQIPALIISVAAGLLATKSGSDEPIDRVIIQQLVRYPNAIAVSSGLLMIFGLLVPGVPFIPFAIISSIGGIIYFVLFKKKDNISSSLENENTKKSDDNGEKSDNQQLIRSLQVDPIRIELGYSLLMLANSKLQDDVNFTDQIKKLRNRLAKELGFILPSVRITDNVDIEPKQYVIKIKDVACGTFHIEPNHLMLINTKRIPNITIPGIDTYEPAFGIPARWISIDFEEEAIFNNYTVVDPVTLLITHLAEVVKENISELLSYSDVQNLINGLSDDVRKLADSFIPTQISMIMMQRILQNLLNEGIAIRDIGTILEAISEIAHKNPGISRLVEHVRYRMSRHLCKAYANNDGYILVLAISAQWEQIFMDNIIGDGDDKSLAMPPSRLNDFILTVNREFENQARNGIIPVLLTSPHLRPFIRNIIERFRPSIVVMSQSEIHPKAKIKTVGRI